MDQNAIRHRLTLDTVPLAVVPAPTGPAFRVTIDEAAGTVRLDADEPAPAPSAG